MKRTISILLAGLLAAGMSLPVFAADPELVYGEDESVDLSGGKTVEAAEDIDAIEVYIGEGVTITIPMEEGKTYRGTATNEPEEDDEEVMGDYAGVVSVLNLTTSGLNALGDTVEIQAEENYYVYNRDLRYLGRSDDPLPYATKYYLSEEELADVNTEPTDPTPGNSQKPAGENPDTGDVSFMGIALAALLLSGVVIGVTLKRRGK